MLSLLSFTAEDTAGRSHRVRPTVGVCRLGTLDYHSATTARTPRGNGAGARLSLPLHHGPHIRAQHRGCVTMASRTGCCVTPLRPQPQQWSQEQGGMWYPCGPSRNGGPENRGVRDTLAAPAATVVRCPRGHRRSLRNGNPTFQGDAARPSDAPAQADHWRVNNIRLCG